jgi:hypothetical protein
MNSVVTGALAGAGEAVKNEAAGFLSAALGEPGKAVGALFSTKINERLFANVVAAAVEAKKMLADAGLSAKEVPLSIIHPALQAAAVEEEPSLQKTWAALLANAADPRQDSPVSPAFIPMLKEMTPASVKFLEALFPAGPDEYGQVNSSVEPAFPGQIRQVQLPPPHFDKDGKAVAPRPEPVVAFRKTGLLDAYVRAGLARFPRLPVASVADWKNHGEDLKADHENCQYLIDLLKRNTILSESVTTPPVDVTKLVANVVSRTSQRHELKVQPVPVYSLTQLGHGFIRACRPPRPGAISKP